MRFFVGGHLHHVFRLGGKDNVRHQRVVGETLHRHGDFRNTPTEPARCGPDGHACHAEGQRAPSTQCAKARSGLPPCRSLDRGRNPPRRHGFVEQRVKRAMEVGVHRPPPRHLCGGVRMGGQIRLHRGAACGRQAPVCVGVEFVDVNVGRHGSPHFTRCSAAPPPAGWDAAGVPSSATRMRSRARDRRDITVPTGTPSTSAASL